MITEDYVSFETAKLLKEKGFNEFTYSYYSKDDEESEPKLCMETLCSDNWNGVPEEVNDLWFSAPTIQMAMKWLREKEWFICIIPLAFYCGEKAVKFGYNIWAGDNLEIDESSTPEFNTYEEACEAAIKYCLENLI